MFHEIPEKKNQIATDLMSCVAEIHEIDEVLMISRNVTFDAILCGDAISSERWNTCTIIASIIGVELCHNFLSSGKIERIVQLVIATILDNWIVVEWFLMQKCSNTVIYPFTWSRVVWTDSYWIAILNANSVFFGRNFMGAVCGWSKADTIINTFLVCFHFISDFCHCNLKKLIFFHLLRICCWCCCCLSCDND